MARKINEILLKRLLNGDLQPLLNYVKSDKKLRIEVRRGGKAFVYYRKGKALEIGLRSCFVDNKYVKNTKFSIPDVYSAKKNPEIYFKKIKEIIDNWVDNNKKRQEFDTQQKIAINNQEIEDKYIIIDMEYNFSQSDITEINRVKKAGFDLLGLERKTGKIVFFEVKKGNNALCGKAGIKAHIEDFEKCLFWKNKDVFRKNLKIDIENIISDKNELGLINYSLPANFEINDNNIDFIFIYEPTKDCSIDDYLKIFDDEFLKIDKPQKKYQSLFVSETNKYKLKEF